MNLNALKTLFESSEPRRRFFVPEVIQASAMDCGPATLKCMLEGFGISVSYGRLREACQTDVDGTSVDVMEEVAVRLGLEAEQVMVPADHLLLPEAQTLPAIVVVRMPNGLTHFVVVWRLHGHLIQVMDPCSGRRWLTHRQFVNELYIHTHPVPADAWREWAGSDGFCDPLRDRMGRLGPEAADADWLIETALADPGWFSLASLDASVRMVENIVAADGLDRGKEAGGVLDSLFVRAIENPLDTESLIPAPFWSVQPPADPRGPEDMLLLKGAVLVRVTGTRTTGEGAEEISEDEETDVSFSPELMAALEEKPSRPELEILRMLREDGLLTPSALILALAMAVIGVTIEALLFRGMLDIGHSLNLTGQRLGAMTALFVFVVGLLLIEIPIASAVTRMGRRLETRLRIAFLEKIPRLGDRYFHSRLTSDMAQRVHELRSIRDLPNLGFNFIRIVFQILLTGAGVILFVPDSALIAIMATTFAIGTALMAQPVLVEQDLRLRTHVGALSRFYLDALLGLIPVRTHCAERSVRREHEGLLVEWVRTGMDFLRAETVMGAIEALGGVIFSVWILFNYVSRGGDTGGVLLLFYWTLNLPVLGKSLAEFALQYPMQRNRILRLFEPLGAPEDENGEAPDDSASPDAVLQPPGGVAVALDNVTVHAGGQMILNSIDLTLTAGEHVAVVGPSGAGKSSLVGLLLGWHRPTAGQIRVNDHPLKGRQLEALRRMTVWVDPEVRLWNRSLFENLRYGRHGADGTPMSKAIDAADLFNVLERLPNGMQTRLGEGGGLVSGGEGQRVRLGRGMFRDRAGLVILDEPFRGLDREKRQALLRRARQHWQNATLIFISHDVGEALSFGRVLVVEEGRLVEDDVPQALSRNPDSRYHALLASERRVRKDLWEGPDWRRLWLDEGQLESRSEREE